MATTRIRNTPPMNRPIRTGPNTWLVESRTEEDKVYTVMRLADGTLSCNCVHGHFKPHGTCWHLIAVGNRIAEQKNREIAQRSKERDARRAGNISLITGGKR